MNFQVIWKIDLEADSAEEAAAKALIIQRDNDPNNMATVFEVQCTEPPYYSETVDLSSQGGEGA